MLSLFRFIARHSSYLLFLVYCSVSLLLIQLQREETLHAIRELGMEANASIAELFSKFSGFLALKQENEHLLLQNARFFSQVMRQRTALLDAKNLDAVISRDTAGTGRFRIARVIDRRFSSKENVLFINAGSLQGVTRDMAVVTPDGLVGRITFVSRNYAKVLPVINDHFMVSVVSDSTNTFGVLSWKGGNERIAQVEHVPISSALRNGEQMLTSDYSTFALRGIPVGRVIRVRKDKLFYKIDVQLDVDFSSLSYVLISPARSPHEKIEVISGEAEQQEKKTGSLPERSGP